MTTSKSETSMCSYSDMTEGAIDKMLMCHEGQMIAISLSATAGEVLVLPLMGSETIGGI